VFVIVREMGKVIGGTKGNKVLEYISGAPVKEQVIERIPDVFDYDQLSKYGYSVRSEWRPVHVRVLWSLRPRPDGFLFEHSFSCSSFCGI
jgi:hypothetical protein